VSSPILSDNLVFLVEHLSLPDAVGDPDATWENFQLSHLNNPSLLAIESKSRQVGWSWLAAAESVASAINNPRVPHIFVSINQDEAGEKIRYAKAVIEALDVDVRPKLITDNRFELEFQNGSRLISHPCRPVRGKAKAVIYLDEFAHYPNDREIYQSALPAISKGGRMRIGSSPLGARGVFWEIYAEAFRKYPGYVRGMVPWWATSSMCKDVKMAAMVAPALPTEDRVYAFGTPRLIQIFENMVLDDFQQEYECAWLDESVSWIDWDLIKRNQSLAADEKLWYRKVRSVDAAMQAVNEVARMCIEARIEPTLVGGMDIGRKHDTTEIILLGKNSQLSSLPYRLQISLDRVEFEKQEAVVGKILDVLPVTNFLIDDSGMGSQLAENISGRYPQAQGVTFTNERKELWAVEAKLRCQKGEAQIPLERDLAYQIHSIRRKVTGAASSTFDTEGNEKHHADMFWAWALALWAGKSDGAAKVRVTPNPLARRRG
jgi:phage FluMu gp28-like protein